MGESGELWSENIYFILSISEFRITYIIRTYQPIYHKDLQQYGDGVQFSKPRYKHEKYPYCILKTPPNRLKPPRNSPKHACFSQISSVELRPYLALSALVIVSPEGSHSQFEPLKSLSHLSFFYLSNASSYLQGKNLDIAGSKPYSTNSCKYSKL